MENKEPFATVTRKHLEAVLECVKNDFKEETDEIPMELIVPSLFPELWKNFKKNMQNAYDLGVEDGKKCSQKD